MNRILITGGAGLVGLAFVTLWVALAVDRYRGFEHLGFVEVRCESDDKKTLQDLRVAAVSPWNSEKAMRMESDGVWRIAKVHDSGKRVVKAIVVDASPDALRSLAKCAWSLSASLSADEPCWKTAAVSLGDHRLFLTMGPAETVYSRLPSRKDAFNWGGDLSLLLRSGQEAVRITVRIAVAFLALCVLWRAAGEA
jgi:hypothetical protein